MEPRGEHEPPQMAREEKVVPRLAVPIGAIVLALFVLMTTSHRFASEVAGALHLATAADLRTVRAEAREARYRAAGVSGFEDALADIHARQAGVESRMNELSTDYDKRFHGPFPEALLRDLDAQMQEVEGRLAAFEDRLATACARIRPRC